MVKQQIYKYKLIIPISIIQVGIPVGINAQVAMLQVQRKFKQKYGTHQYPQLYYSAKLKMFNLYWVDNGARDLMFRIKFNYTEESLQTLKQKADNTTYYKNDCYQTYPKDENLPYFDLEIESGYVEYAVEFLKLLYHSM